MKSRSTSRRFGLIAAVTALALGIAAPAALAHDEVRLSGKRTPAGAKFTVPVPGVGLPEFSLDVNGRTVNSSAVPSAVGGGQMIVRVSALNTLPIAYLSRHCDGLAGTQLHLERIGPGALVGVSWSPSTTSADSLVQRLATQRIGVRRTSVDAAICAGL